MWSIPTSIPFQKDVLVKSLGQWGGMSIIALGPRGGKIVGYGSGGKPIYAGSVKARELVAVRQAAVRAKDPVETGKAIKAWLIDIGIPVSAEGIEVWTSPEAGQLLLDSFGTKPHHTGTKVWKFKTSLLEPHVGKPLTPHGAEKAAWAAKAASGDLEHDPFPKDLSTLKEIPAGKAAGSHDNKLFKSPDGRKWLFKTHDNVIARAEEAAARLGRLVFGKELVAAARYVKLSGQDGVLLEWKDGSEIPQGEYHQTGSEFIDKHFGHFVEHEVFDWLISNHDSHAGNFLVDDDKLLVIDKGQAWRFFPEDELAPDYSPNPSKPVYVKLWTLFKNGAISKPEGVFSAVAKILERIETITPEQFREIIGPYVATRAKKEGKNPNKIADQMVARLQSMREDWTKFLTQVTGQPAAEVAKKIQGKKAPGKDNFETMPEVEGKPGKKKVVPVITEPDKPAAVEGGAKAPIVPKAAPGWPQTKGKVTVHHPGYPTPPEVKWPGGYPGPGFQVSIDYKHKNYSVEFMLTGPAGAENVPTFVVYYPDGQKQVFDSPNKASDSLYLFEKGLPLTMGATEKKAKGISYPASKAFGIMAFKAELAEAQGNDKTPNEMTPAELEAAKIIDPGAKTMPAEKGDFNWWKELEPDVWTHVDPGSNAIPDLVHYAEGQIAVSTQDDNGYTTVYSYDAGVWKYMGQQVAFSDVVDALTKHGGDVKKIAPLVPEPEKDVSKYPVHQAPVGTTYKLENIISDQTHIWKKIEPGKWEGPGNIHASDDHMLKMIKESGWDVAEHTPSPPAPTATVTAGATVEKPKGAPSTNAIAPGTTITVEKPGLGKVALQIKDEGDGYAVAFVYKGTGVVESFKSISAAAKFAFIHQKGYASVEEYKKATGKDPPGVSWGYFNLKSGPPAKPALAKEPSATGEVTTHPIDMGTLAVSDLAKAPEETLITFTYKGENFKAEKGKGPGVYPWSVENLSDPGEPYFLSTSTHLLEALSESTNIEASEDLKIAPVVGAKKTPSKANWETMPPSLPGWARMPVGSVAEATFKNIMPVKAVVKIVHPDGETWIATKKSPDEWSDGFTVLDSGDMAKKVKTTPGHVYVQVAEGGPVESGTEVWKDPATWTMDTLNMAPYGTKILAIVKGDPFLVMKTGTDMWQYATGGNVSSSGLLEELDMVPGVQIAYPGEAKEEGLWTPQLKMTGGAVLTKDVLMHAPIGASIVASSGGETRIYKKGTDLSWYSDGKGYSNTALVTALTWADKIEIASMKSVPPQPTVWKEIEGQGSVTLNDFPGGGTALSFYGTAPAGSSVILQVGKTQQPPATILFQKEGDFWVNKTQAGEPSLTSLQIHKKVDELASSIDIQAPPAVATTAEVSVSVFQVAGLEQGEIAAKLKSLEVGTEIHAFDKNGPTVWKKQDSGGWNVKFVSASGDPQTSALLDMDAAKFLQDDAKDSGKNPVIGTIPTPVTEVFPVVGFSEDEILSKLQPFGVGTEIHGFDANGPTKWKKISEASWTVEFQQPNGASKGHLFGEKDAAHFLKMDAEHSGKEPGIGGPVAAPKKSLYPPNVQTSDAKLPPKAKEEYNNVLPTAIEWASQKSESGNAIVGAKPTTWPPWVPPPGVLIEGKIGGKSYWITSVIAGHVAKTGEPGPETQISIIDEEGNIHSGTKVKGKMAIKSLSAATASASLSMSTAEMKEIWGLNNLVFAPGETFLTVKEGTGPSAVPPAPVKVKSVTIVQKKMVKSKMPLSEALEHDSLVKEHGVKIKQGKTTFDLVIDGTDGAANVLQEIVKKYDLTEVITKQKSISPSQASVSVPIWALNHDIVAMTTEYEAVSKPQAPGEDNWETMPDYVPQVIKPDADEGTVQKILEGVPIGTALVKGEDVYFKGMDEHWYSQSAGKLAKAPIWIFTGYKTTVVPPGAEKPEPVPVTFAPVVAWKKSKEQVEKTAKAKAVGAWAKKNGPLVNMHALRAMAYLQQKFPEGMEVWARQTSADEILIGSDNPGFTAFWKELGIQSSAVKTPLGTWQKLTTADIVAKIPEAGWFKGPDGKQYPVGTKFVEEEKITTVGELIMGEPAYYKFSEHKTDTALTALKIKGTGPEQIEAAKAIAKKYGLDAPEPKVGGSNVILTLKKDDVTKTGKTETVTTPQIPPAPPAFKAKGMPIGSAELGAPAPVNRQDLAVIDSMKMGRTGHSVRMGKHGIFRDGQVYFRRVRQSDGSIVIEATGQLENRDFEPKSLTLGEHVYKQTAGTSVPGYNAKQQTYDEATDAQVEVDESIRTYNAHVGKTEAGSSISLMNESGKQSVHGTFVVRLAAGKDPEQELAQAFASMGLDVNDALATPSDEDVRKTTKLMMVRALLGPQSWSNLQFAGNVLDEEWMDKQLEGHEDKLAGAEWQWVSPGRQAPVVNDTEAYKKADVAFVYIGVSSVGSVVARMLDGFFAANKKKVSGGVVGNVTSLSSDETHGGSWNVFSRLGNRNVSGSWGYACHGPKLIFHPRILNRLDWYAHDGDSYGSTQSGSDSRYKAMKNKDSDNEVLFGDSMSFKDLAGVLFENLAQKQEFLEYAKEAGLPDSFNGIPLEKFVIVESSNDREVVEKKCIGLQEGVLP